MLVCAGSEGKMVQYALSTGEVARTLQHTSEVRCVACHNGTIACSGNDGNVSVWSDKNVGERRVFAVARGKTTYGLAIHGDTLVSGGIDKVVRVWSIKRASS